MQASIMKGCVTGRAWTVEDLAWIRAFGAREDTVVLSVQLDRSATAIHRKRYALQLERKRRPWTPREEERLRMLWGLPLKQVAVELGRTEQAVYWRAGRLGLPCGCPNGYEYLTAATRRTGFADTCTLRRILRWAGVHIHRSFALQPSHDRNHIVDPDKVDDAVASWLATETPGAAAKRLGVCRDTVIKHLEASGLPLPKRPGWKLPWRTPSDVIDRAMAMVQRQGKQLVVVHHAAREIAL